MRRVVIIEVQRDRSAGAAQAACRSASSRLVRLPCERLNAGDRPFDIAKNLRCLTTPYVQHIDSIRKLREEHLQPRAGSGTSVPSCGSEFTHQIPLRP
jgi:hypothetical protein